MYIALEGVVGTGKTTQLGLLIEMLSIRYPDRELVQVREPGGTEIAEAIRVLVQGTDFNTDMQALTDVYLYAAARAELLYSTVLPALNRGALVVSDRSVCSSLAIQGLAQGVGLDRVWKINQEALAVLPDKVYFLDLDVDVGLSRTFDSDGDKREKKHASFSHSVYQGYQSLFSFEPLEGRLVSIDASGTIDDVFNQISEKVGNII